MNNVIPNECSNMDAVRKQEYYEKVMRDASLANINAAPKEPRMPVRDRLENNMAMLRELQDKAWMLARMINGSELPEGKYPECGDMPMLDQLDLQSGVMVSIMEAMDRALSAMRG